MRVSIVFASLAVLASLVSASLPTPPQASGGPGGAATPGAAKPQGYKITDGDKKLATEQLALLKAITCCKEHKCGPGTNVEKVYQKLKETMWEHPELRLGYVLSRFNRMFRGEKKKDEAKPKEPPKEPQPGGAGAKTRRHNLPQYQFAMVQVLMITLETISKATYLPPQSADRRYTHLKSLVDLLKFDKPSMKPDDAKDQKKIARSLLWYIQGDTWVVGFLHKHGFAKSLKAAYTELKKETGGKDLAAVSKDLTAELQKVHDTWKKKKEEKPKTKAY